jgi:hypothetical protein
MSTNPRDETFIRAGLAKSAFRESIYEGLPWTYYMDYIVSVQRMLRHMVRILPRVKLILVDYTYEPSYNWVKLLKQHNNVMLVNDVASFENAVKRALANA